MNLVSPKPIISLKEARKLLGKDFRHLSDEQVETIILLLDTIAQDVVAKTVPDS